MSLTLAERVRSVDVRAIARAISLIEDEAEAAAGLVRDIFPHTGRTYLVGVTGPPGAGKSTLVDRLTAETRKAGETVGVIAGVGVFLITLCFSVGNAVGSGLGLSMLIPGTSPVMWTIICTLGVAAVLSAHTPSGRPVPVRPPG